MTRMVVTSVDEYNVDGRLIVCDCTLRTPNTDVTTADSQTIPVSIRFLSPGCFRFEMRANPETVNGESALDHDENAVESSVNLRLTERDDELQIQTDELTVIIGLDEWAFQVFNKDNNLLLEEQRRDINAKSELRSDPLGMTTEVVNRWPLRVDSVGSAYVLSPDEQLYGLGEKFTDLNKRGQHISSWITQPNGTETETAYKNVPLYFSSRGYGLFVDTTRRTEFDFGCKSTVTTDIEVEGDVFSYYFFKGPLFKDLLQSYTALTGRPHLPPKWTFGVWMSRLGYESREELESVASELRERNIPCDVLHLDPYWMNIENLSDLQWDRKAFPDPEEMIKNLNDLGFHISLWEYPYINVNSPLFKTAAERGLFVTDGTGSTYILSRFSVDERGAILDFTNSETREWWADKHRELVAMGVDVFKLDFGEYLPRDAVLNDGRSGSVVRNEYPRLYQETVARGMREAGIDRPTLWTRAGWAGDQVFPIHWGGDPYTSFESMGASLRGGLSLGLSGYLFWSVDIGGFRGEPSKELYIRWAQWGLLGTSHARFHGTTPREPWEFDSETETIVTKYIRERYRLLPYIYTSAARATTTGIPVMRPLVLEYQQDPAVWNMDTQYLFGRDLLVAPVLSTDSQTRVYLPEGEWVDYWTNKRYEGKQTLRLTPDLNTMPLYIRAGTILPRREPIQSVGCADEYPELNLRIEFSTAESSDTTTDKEMMSQTTTGGQCSESEYYCAQTNSFHQIRATVSAEDSVSLSYPSVVPVVRATLRQFEKAPEGVSVNGIELTEVEDEPDTGNWIFNEATQTVELVVSESQTDS